MNNKNSPSRQDFIQETLYKDFGFSFQIEEVLHREKDALQDLIIFKNNFFGKVMMLDGATQITTKDEFIYQEMMVHVPMFAFGNPKSVLIIGGGDGGIAREVLKHRNIDVCVQVEIDKNVVDFSLRHFPEISQGAFADQKLKLLIEDGAKFVANSKDKFDIIIVDSTDPDGPASVLFTQIFYENCHKCLSGNGILVTQNGVPFLQPKELISSISYFRQIFQFGSCYLASIPTYIGGQMAMGFATDSGEYFKLSSDILWDRFAKLNIETKYYNPDVHLASFALPNFIKNLLS
jgi:spermidine synthase